MERLHIVPVPEIIQEDTRGAGVPNLKNIHANILLAPAVCSVGEYSDRAGLNGKSAVQLLYSASFSGENWMMRSDEDGVSIACGTVEGAQRALAVLFQIAYQCGDRMPGFIMKSSPDSDFRAVMIDLARNWHEYRYLTEYVDMCWLYGIRYLHLHFTDDQSYTLPSVKYPKLSTEGRCYTWEQISQLDEYAAARGIEIIPEIDVPGHCTSFISAYGDIFGREGIIAQTRESMNAMAELFGELCVMFPHSHYIHVGGDEAAIIKWTENEACRDYAESCGIDFGMEDRRYLSERMLANFVDKMADAVRAKGRMPIAWEGFASSVNTFVNHEILMESWENFYQTTPELLEGDFEIINSSWRPMYVVTPKRYWSQEEVYNWGIYSWQPIHRGSPYYDKTLRIEPDRRVRGGQLLAWGDCIGGSYPVLEEGLKEEQRLVEERAAILSERTWNTEQILTATEFISDAAVVMELLQKIKK